MGMLPRAPVLWEGPRQTCDVNKVSVIGVNLHVNGHEKN